MKWFRPSPRKIFASVLGDIDRNDFFQLVDKHTAIVAAAAVVGAATVGELAVSMEPSLKHLWGRGDKTKANALIEVFSRPMLLRWLASVEEGKRPPKKTRNAVRAEWGKLLLNSFGSFSEERLQRFLDLDTQYQYEKKETKKHFEEAYLLWAEAVEALGGTSPFSGWPAKGFPFSDRFALWDAGVDLNEGPDMPIDLMLALAAGWHATADYYTDEVEMMR